MAFVLEEETQEQGRFVLEEETTPLEKPKKSSNLANIPDFNRGINKEGVKFLENAIVGTFETGAGLALGMAGWAGGTLAGLTTYVLTGDEKAAQAVSEGTAQQIQGNFQPKTEFGIEATSIIGSAIEGVFGAIHKGAEWTAEELQENPINKLLLDFPEDQLLKLDPITQTSLRAYRHFFDTREKKTYLLKIAGEIAGGKAIHTTGVKGVEVTKALPEYLKQLTGRNADPARVITEKTKIAEEAKPKEDLTKTQEGGNLLTIEERHYEYFTRRFEEAGIDPKTAAAHIANIRGNSGAFGGDVGARILDPLQAKGVITRELRNTLYEEWQTWDALRTAKDTSNIKQSGDALGRSVDETRAAELTRQAQELKKTPPEERALIAEARKYKTAEEFIDNIAKTTRPIRDAQPGELVRISSDFYGEKTPKQYNLGIPRVGEIVKINPVSVSVKVGDKIYKFPSEAKISSMDLKTFEGMNKHNISEWWNKAQEGKAETGPLSELRLAEQRGSISLEKTEKPKLHEFPEDIQARWDAARPKEPTTGERIREKLDTFVNRAMRTFEHLPRTAEYAPLQFELLNLLKYKGVSSTKATMTLAQEVKKMDAQLFDVFEKKVVLDDLYYCANKGMDLPFGLTPDRLGAEKILIDNLSTKHPEIMKAVETRKATWDKIKEDYTKAMEDIGFDVGDRFKNPDYYHHQVLEMARARELVGTGKKLKTPAGRGFLKRREGSQMDINRDYLQVEHDVMAQMLYDTKVAEVIKFVDQKYNIAEKVQGEYKAALENLYKEVTGDKTLKNLAWNERTAYALKKKIHGADSKALEKSGLDDWRGNLPDGYDLWQPREGNVFYMTDSIPSQIAKELVAGALDEFGVTAADVKKVLAVGGPRKQFVLKKEIVETLDNITKKPTDSIVSKGSRWLMGQWKEKIALIHPRGFFKYNARNMSGDAEGVFLGNPAAFKMTPQAFKDLWNAFYGDGKMTPELNKFFEMGGYESTLQAIEIKSFGDISAFKHLFDKKTNISEIPGALWEKYWKGARMATDFRETLLRYANFLEYRNQMLRNPEGLPKNYGASIPEEIKALGDIDKRAYWLQNDLLGAYDRVGVIGQYLREHIWPFWSWKEVNARRFIQLFRNAANDGKLASTIGKKLGAKTPWMAYKIGGLVVKLTGALALLDVYNNTFFPEEEKDLPNNVRDSTHIIFGRDSEGNVIYFNRLGIFKDFLENFGLQDAPSQVVDVLHGKKTIKEMALEIVKGPVNVFVSGLSPYYKLPAELATRQKSFPDIFKRGLIRDRGLYVAEQLRLGPEYKAIMGLPTKGYDEAIKSLFVYTADPDQSAYFAIMDLKRRYAEKAGKGGEGYFITPRGDALYNYKLAIRFEDSDAAEHYFNKYIELGGTYQGFKQSLRAMHPLWGLNDFEKMEFVMSLDAEDTERLYKAIDYYIDNLYESAEYAPGEIPIQEIAGAPLS